MEKIRVIKIGGSLIDEPQALESFLKTLALPKSKFILVHGGGKLLEGVAVKLGVEQKKVDGRRITTAETRDIALMVYAGLINKKIVASLAAKGCPAVGLTGADASVIPSKQRVNSQIDFGFVGDTVPEKVNVDFIQSLLNIGCCPVFSAITIGEDGELLNTNADTVAAVIASAVSKIYQVELIYCFDKDGVLDKNSTVISAINPNEKDLLIQDGSISAGMLPKLSNGFEALSNGASVVFYTHDSRIENILTGDFSNGTLLLAND